MQETPWKAGRLMHGGDFAGALPATEYPKAKRAKTTAKLRHSSFLISLRPLHRTDGWGFLLATKSCNAMCRVNVQTVKRTRAQAPMLAGGPVASTASQIEGMARGCLGSRCVCSACTGLQTNGGPCSVTPRLPHSRYCPFHRDRHEVTSGQHARRDCLGWHQDRGAVTHGIERWEPKSQLS